MHFISLKKETSDNSKYSAFASFAPIFLIQTLSFVEGRRKNIFCPRAQGTLAMPLLSNGSKVSSTKDLLGYLGPL